MVVMMFSCTAFVYISAACLSTTHHPSSARRKTSRKRNIFKQSSKRQSLFLWKSSWNFL